MEILQFPHQARPSANGCLYRSQARHLVFFRGAEKDIFFTTVPERTWQALFAENALVRVQPQAPSNTGSPQGPAERGAGKCLHRLAKAALVKVMLEDDGL